MRLAALVVCAAALIQVAGAEEKPPEALPAGRQGQMRARVVDVQTVNMTGITRVVLRAEGPSEPYIDIFVGPVEGEAIARALSGKRTPRPMTHDLFASVLKGLGASVARLEVTSLKEDVFIGKLVLTCGEKELTIDSRPSDGMALAIAAGAPIYISNDVIEKTGRAEEGKEEGEEDLPAGPRPFGPPRDLI